MWATLGVVVLLTAGAAAWLLTRIETPEVPPLVAATDASPERVDGEPEPPVFPTDPPFIDVPSTDDTNPPEPDPGPDLTPEHVDRAAFDEVFDDVIEECTLGPWSEMKRGCTDWRCLALIAAPVEPGKMARTVDDIVGCPAWTESWGKHPDYWLFGAQCEDGTPINISLLGPSTLRMRRGIDQGFIDEFQVDIDGARDEACRLWGK